MVLWKYTGLTGGQRRCGAREGTQAEPAGKNNSPFLLQKPPFFDTKLMQNWYKIHRKSHTTLQGRPCHKSGLSYICSKVIILKCRILLFFLGLRSRRAARPTTPQLLSGGGSQCWYDMPQLYRIHHFEYKVHRFWYMIHRFYYKTHRFWFKIHGVQLKLMRRATVLWGKPTHM